MALPVRSPSSPLTRLHDELDRVLDEFTAPSNWPWAERKAFNPALDMYEKDNRIIVEAELPGVPREAVKITCEDHHLYIQGEVKKEDEQKREGYYRLERRSGSFYRSVQLPSGVDTAKATAEFHDGVLRVSLPKLSASESELKNIPISG